jgi:hypothetical protein
LRNSEHFKPLFACVDRTFVDQFIAPLSKKRGGLALPAKQAELRITANLDESAGRPILPTKALRAKTLAAQRDRLLAMRSDGVIGDEAFHQLEEELDFSELAVLKRS